MREEGAGRAGAVPGGTRKKSGACPHGGPDSRPDNRANSCAAQRVLRRCLATRYATDLLFGKLPAQDIVDLKLIAGLARSRQHHHVRTDRHRGAGTKECQHREKYRPFLAHASSPPIVVVATTD